MQTLKRKINFQEQITGLRTKVSKAIQDATGKSFDELAEFEIAIGEAIANAIEHGNRSDGDLDVHVTVNTTKLNKIKRLLTIRIGDHGSGFDPPRGEVPMPPPDSLRSRGIALMQQICGVAGVSWFHSGGLFYCQLTKEY